MSNPQSLHPADHCECRHCFKVLLSLMSTSFGDIKHFNSVWQHLNMRGEQRSLQTGCSFQLMQLELCARGPKQEHRHRVIKVPPGKSNAEPETWRGQGRKVLKVSDDACWQGLNQSSTRWSQPVSHHHLELMGFSYFTHLELINVIKYKPTYSSGGFII